MFFTGAHTGDGWAQLACRCGHVDWYRPSLLPRDGTLVAETFESIEDDEKLRRTIPGRDLRIPAQSDLSDPRLMANPTVAPIPGGFRRLAGPLKIASPGGSAGSSIGRRIPAAQSTPGTFIDEVFQQKIARTLKGYVDRPAQRQLARAIATCYARNQILVAEAGVGIGKSMAYLIPALYKNPDSLSKIPQGFVVISTATIRLQQQLITKDIPFVLGILGLQDLNVMLAKGRSHYLCPRRLDCLFNAHRDNLDLQILADWQDSPRCHAHYGDQDYAPILTNPGLWDRVCVQKCPGPQCPQQHYCGYARYKYDRKRAQGILVVNHDLLIADLFLRPGEDVGLWPTPSLLVIDEAHLLEGVAQRRLERVLNFRDMEHRLERAAKHPVTRYRVGAPEVRRCVETVHNFFEGVRSVDWVEGSENPYILDPSNVLQRLARIGTRVAGGSGQCGAECAGYDARRGPGGFAG